MKRILRCAASVAILGLSTAVQAGLFGSATTSPVERCDSGTVARPQALPCDAESDGPRQGCNLLKGLFGGKKRAPACSDDIGSREIATQIHRAQTSRDPGERERAVDELGEFDACRHPEVIAALVDALNDCEEDVREEAADSIGDMLEDGRCCCTPEVVAALCCALEDCDDDVRSEVKDALEACEESGLDDLWNGCGVGANVPPAPTLPSTGEFVPSPAPPANPPSPMSQPASREGSLTSLFGVNQDDGRRSERD